MKFVLTFALAMTACGPLSRVQEAETASNRGTQASTDTLPPEKTPSPSSPVVAPALRPALQTADETTSATSQAPSNPTPPSEDADATGTPSEGLPPAQPSEPVVEELDIEERTGKAEDFSEHALVFDLDEYGKDKRQVFELAQSAEVPEWVSGLGFLFSEAPRPLFYDTNENLSPFRGWAAHAALRLFQYQKQKTTVFRLTLFGENRDVEKEKDDVKDKSKNQKKLKDGGKNEDKAKKRLKSRSRLVLELSVKNGRPLLQLQTKIAGKKAKNVRVKGKARLPANQELHLVASIKGTMLRLFSGTHLIGETNFETFDEKWTHGELILGASHDHGKAAFIGFLRELEFADSLPLEYQ